MALDDMKGLLPGGIAGGRAALKALSKKEKQKLAKARAAKLRKKGMNSGPRKPLSSKMLTDKSVREGIRKDKAGKRKFGDRGMSGNEEIEKVTIDAGRQMATDEELIEQYGMDAPKARSFMTPENNPKIEKLGAGGMAKKKPVKKNMGGMMKYNKGGKVRGSGLARRKRT